jgi:hypothetical protein
MGNIRDIEARVSVAEAIEKTNRDGASFRYETAERELEKHILLFGLTIDDLDGNDGSEVAEVYRPLFQRIKNGYKRISDAKKSELV